MTINTVQTFTDNWNFNSVSQTPLILAVGNMSKSSVQATAQSAGWTTAVLTVEVSNDGAGWCAVQAGAVTLTSGAASKVTATIDVSSVAYLRVRVSTAEGSALTGRVTIWAVDA